MKVFIFSFVSVLIRCITSKDQFLYTYLFYPCLSVYTFLLSSYYKCDTLKPVFITFYRSSDIFTIHRIFITVHRLS